MLQVYVDTESSDFKSKSNGLKKRKLNISSI
jgi:hypothetical protein